MSLTQRNLANTWICVVFNSWIRDSVETSCCGHFWICKLAWTLHNWSLLVGSKLEIYPSEEVRSPGAIVIASIVGMFIVFPRLFRHFLNLNGLRMFQISVMINLKAKFEGSFNRPCAEHKRHARITKSLWVTEQAVDMEISTETCTHKIKEMSIHSIISFVSEFFFRRFGSYANFGLLVMVISSCYFAMQTWLFWW